MTEETIIRSEEHAEARRGRITGSRVGTLMSATWRGLNSLAELMRGQDKFYTLEDTPGMPLPLRWGLTHEPAAIGEFFDRHIDISIGMQSVYRGELNYPTLDNDARRIPEDIADFIAVSPDFITLPNELLMTPVQLPDGDVDFDAAPRFVNGGGEIKCPLTFETMQAYVMGHGWEKHKPQIMLNILLTGAPGWWFVAFDPREDDRSIWRYHEQWVPRDEAYIAMMIEKIRWFRERYDTNEPFQPEGVTARQINDAL